MKSELRVEIDARKAKARKAYEKMRAAMDDVDCGAAMLREISPAFRVADDEFQAHIAWLKTNDPTFPKGG